MNPKRIEIVSDGFTLLGDYINNGKTCTVVFFHENATNIYGNIQLYKMYQLLGVNLLLFPYRGYSYQGGTPNFTNI